VVPSAAAERAFDLPRLVGGRRRQHADIHLVLAGSHPAQHERPTIRRHARIGVHGWSLFGRSS
jgi:hypothetical protein